MTTTVVWTPVLWGQHDGFVWAAINPAAASTTGVNVGILFDANNHQGLSYVLVGGDSRILEGPIVTSFALTCDTNRGAAVPALLQTLEFGVVPDPQPADYTTALAPWSRGEVSLGTFQVLPPVTPAQTTATFTLSTEAQALLRAHVTSRSRWNGRLAISIRNVSTFGSTTRMFNAGLNVNASATTTQEVFFSGLAGAPNGPRIRVVRDGRFGMPLLNIEAVRDGDNKGLWVRAEDWDPEDEISTYRPRPGEGSVDDEIGDL